MIKCFFGLHHYEVYGEEKYVDLWGHEIGKVIISRCQHCGKITTEVVRTVNNGF